MRREFETTRDAGTRRLHTTTILPSLYRQTPEAAAAASTGYHILRRDRIVDRVVTQEDITEAPTSKLDVDT